MVNDEKAEKKVICKGRRPTMVNGSAIGLAQQESKLFFFLAKFNGDFYAVKDALPADKLIYFNLVGYSPTALDYGAMCVLPPHCKVNDCDGDVDDDVNNDIGTKRLNVVYIKLYFMQSFLIEPVGRELESS